MANYNSLKTAIQSAVDWDNNNNEISGNDILAVLLAIINSLGADYQFVGVAQPGTQPGTPDQNVAYIGGSGSYPNFNSANVPVGYIGVFTYNGAWTVQTIQVGGNYDAEIATLFSLIRGYSLPTANNGQITSGGNWNLATQPYHYAIRVNPGDIIKIVGPAQSSLYTYWTILNTYPQPIVSGAAVDYATGYGSGYANFPYIRLDGQTDTGNVTVPNNGHWLYVTKYLSTTTDRTPSAIYINDVNIMEQNGLLFDVEQLKQQVSTIAGQITTINANANTALAVANTAELEARKAEIVVNGYDYGDPIHGVIGSSGVWVLPAAGTSYHYIMKINPGDIVRIIGPSVGGYCRYTFLKSHPSPIVAGTNVDYATGYGPGNDTFPYVQVAKQTDGGNVVAPSDVVYLFFSGVNASVDRTPSAIYVNGVDVMEQATGLENRVAELESGVIVDYPKYFNDNVAAVIAAVQANNVLTGYNGDSFIFTTDNHFPRNFGYAPALAQAVMLKTNNRILIDGGDVFDGGGTKAEELQKFRDFFNNIKGRFGNNFRYTYGNHDNNAANPDTSERISDAELYALGCKAYENDVTFGVESGVRKLYYYWDNPIQKIRYFVLNYHDGVSTTDAQYTWLSSKISELGAGWHVFVFIHICVAASGGDWTIASGYENFVSLLESFGSVVIAVMCGHVHNDGIVYSPTLGMPIIACAQDFASDITQDNTINNACLTFVDIDLDNELLRVVRLGRKPANWGANIAKTIPFRTTI